MKAILVKYLGPTDAHGGRYVATAEGASRVVHPYDHALNSDDNARRAAEKLVWEMGWADAEKPASLAAGTLPNGDRAFCFVNAWTCREIPAREG